MVFRVIISLYVKKIIKRSEKTTMDKLFDICPLTLIQFLLSDRKLRLLTINIKNLSWESELFFDGLIEVSMIKRTNIINLVTIEFKNHQVESNSSKEKNFDNLTFFRIYILKKRIKFVNFRLNRLISF